MVIPAKPTFFWAPARIQPYLLTSIFLDKKFDDMSATISTPGNLSNGKSGNSTPFTVSLSQKYTYEVLDRSAGMDHFSTAGMPPNLPSTFLESTTISGSKPSLWASSAAFLDQDPQNRNRGEQNVWDRLRRGWSEVLERRRGDLVRKNVAQEQIVSVLSWSVSEIILDVSGDGVDQIVQSTQFGSLSGSSEICLQCASSGVRLGHHVGVVCPDVHEHQVELRIDFLPVLRAVDHSALDQLLLQVESAQCGLNNVGSIETVHAVCSDNVALFLGDHKLLGNSDHVEIFLRESDPFQMVDQQLDPVPLHVLALVVEVKVGVLDVWVVQRGDGVFVRQFHRLLVPLLVDQVDQVVCTVFFDHPAEMVSGWNVVCLAQQQNRFIFKVVHLSPEHRHRASGLKIRVNLVTLAGVDGQELLGLVEVGHVTVCVDSTTEISRSCSEARPSADQTERDRFHVDRGAHKLGVSVDDRQHELARAGVRGGQLDQILRNKSYENTSDAEFKCDLSSSRYFTSSSSTWNLVADNGRTLNEVTL
ncbi:hypothetical protein OGAPHI_001576 [Ogataea philodendri]|uniref:Uncharacterized protein n=1 Tax=Ogataea philodendri TaxID=1378263 RepID=A0A9P8T8P9_9ASCO|nr:uncharacterized protein OGAPHI_001576 [Ogataea philodendri]KAH3669455.1 hypothetical protein OGAPHI_001576 [Ogataea philodendri]